MIKRPITKTGEIRYFEFIKIFVLVSFFYAFISTVAHQDQFLYSNASSTLLSVFIGLSIVAFFMATIIGFIDIIHALSIHVVLPVGKTEIKENIVTLINYFGQIVQNNINNTSSHLQLCVIRC